MALKEERIQRKVNRYREVESAEINGKKYHKITTYEPVDKEPTVQELIKELGLDRNK